MSMDVILFRHGPAGASDAERWPDDGLRPLTPRGEQRTLSAAYGLARVAPEIHRVLTSPLTRAVQTARALESVLLDVPVDTLEALRPGGSYREVLEALGALSATERVVLVGHEPDLGQLASTLLFGSFSAIPLKKAGACGIRFEGDVQRGAGRLLWFLSPKILRRLADKKVCS
jgi:phosphohistidine phosphatase